MRSSNVLIITLLTAVTMGCSTTPADSFEMEISTPLFHEPNTIEDIDICIKELQEKRELYEARRLYASREADRLLTLDWLMYRRCSAQAERYGAMVKDIDQEIAVLQRKKIELMQKQPIS